MKAARRLVMLDLLMAATAFAVLIALPFAAGAQTPAAVPAAVQVSSQGLSDDPMSNAVLVALR
jgi:hypothetical protein